jgi:hypothetical protein
VFIISYHITNSDYKFKKDTILPQADDWGFRTPRRSLYQSIPHLVSSRA